MSASLVFLLLTVVVAPAALWRYREDYRRHGRTTRLGVTLLLLAWILPHCVLGFSAPMPVVPHGTRESIGFALMGAGLLLCLLAMRRCPRRTLVGKDTSHLVTTGLYAVSRNPQYAAYFLFPVGYAVAVHRLWGWVGTVLVALVIHASARIEEEHLARAFGEEYRRYRRRTPRYLGSRRPA